MQHDSGETEPQHSQGRWTKLLSRLYFNSEVAQVTKTRVVQHLSTHPFSALTVMLFGAMAALPVGLFISFALVTALMLAIGFVFFEVFLLFAGGLTLLCVLSGLALFSVVVSLILSAFRVTIFNILKYYPKVEVREKESDSKLQD
ncbi:putative promethin isoform 2 [Scophthalmus maximus]|uniref:Putative promethin isoform 2 n=1 Tax=Scophthalmus maximus TaxID=52904 RepID=A0A2U9CSF8_SCOMX|nr:lipid droplet assembly factor 1 isoform X2 [Scophthalmus maximus]AWP18910.1 putative promethin isoform 2 [Scophthalmus maximus]